MEKEKNLSYQREALEIEKSSLISDMENIGPLGQVEGDFESRKIILLRYPIKKELSTI